MADVPVARPSKPSVKFTAFAVPEIIKTNSGMEQKIGNENEYL